MLTYQTNEPTSSGRYLVTYLTPGTSVPTVACDCNTFGQAEGEARRLNAVQRANEMVAQCDRAACGLRGVYHGLEGAA